MENLRQVVYVSAAAHLMRESELLEIIEMARTANAQSHVTALLLYAEGPFIQVLEGEGEVVERLLRKIRRDPRHRGFLILLDRVILERDFDGWPMAFQRVSQPELDAIAGYFEWTAEMPTRRKGIAALSLIESFRQTAIGFP
jgi:hypothetical protein